MFEPLLSMVKVLEPMAENLLVMAFWMEETAVRVPTKAVMPMVIIRMVSMVRNKLDRMEERAM